MEDIVATISEHTGAEIYMIAGWNHAEGVYHYFEYVRVAAGDNADISAQRRIKAQSTLAVH